MLVDSGATETLISGRRVKSSSYLSKLPLQDIEHMRFKIGNGDFLHASKAVNVELNIQGHKLKVRAIVVDNLTGPDILLGASTLTDLQGSIDFTTHTLTIRPKRIQFMPTHDISVRPGHTKHIVIRGKVPKILKHSEILLQAGRQLSSFCPTYMLVKLHKNSAIIKVTNHSKKCVVFREKQPIAFTDLGDYVHATSSVPQSYFTSQVDRNQCASDLHYQNLLKYPHLDINDPISRLSPQEIIEQQISLKGSVLQDDEKQNLYELLLRNKEAFSLYGEIGSCPDFEVDIELKDDSPFFIRPYPVAEENKKHIDQELEKLVKLGILKKGCSAYTSPVMLISKKGTTEKRTVSDFRYLNSRCKTVNQNYISLQSVLAKLGSSNCKVLSVIDLKSAFHTLPLSQKSQAYTGICPYPGSQNYMYRRLPMGLTVSSGIFSEKCNAILAEIPNSDKFVIPIHDDILVYSKTKSDHAHHLDLVLQALQKHGLKLSTRKARLFQSKVIFVGHQISINAEGIVQISAMNDKCAAIRNMPQPRTPKQIKRFIGAVGFLSQYLPRLQELLKPLHILTKRNSPFKWKPEHEEAFQQIKTLLVAPPVLCAPSPEGEFILYSDTSRIATGSCLTQLVDGHERIIAYYSKRLPPAATSYSVSELELFGLWINVQSFSHLLQSRSFTAYVDHSSLVHIVKSKTQPCTLRLQKLIERLSHYSFELRYKKGSDLVISDFLSRAPCDDDDIFDRISPIAFPVQRWYEPDSAFPIQHQPTRPVTRSYARRMNIPIQPLFEPVRDQPDPQPPVPPANVNDNQMPADIQPNPRIIHDHPQRPVPAPRVAPVPAPRIAPVPLHNNIMPPAEPQAPPIRRPLPQVQEPRLVDRVLEKQRHEEHIKETLPEFLLKPEPLVSDADKISATHIPRQNEINKILKILQRKVIRDYNLPFDAQQFRLAQQSSSFLGPIYQYLAFNILPQDKKSAKSIMLRSEQYLLCDNILFRLVLPPNSDDFCFQLAVPEKFIDPLLRRYHDSVTASHQGCVRTYVTLRKLFYFPNMYQRIVSYIRSCATCQQFKGKTDNERPFHERVPTRFCPFETLSLDFKTMMPSRTGYRHLMVVTCAISRFVVLAPLKTLDASTIAEVLIQKVLCNFGIPEVIVSDQATSLTGKIVSLLCDTLGISQKVISVQNHGSLHTERMIQSVANLIKVNLEQYGQDWVRYYSVAQYAFNSFSSNLLGGQSPFSLVFLREPRNISGLNFKPMLGLSHSQAEYVDHLKEKFQNVSKVMLQLQQHQQESQNQKIARKLSKCPLYTQGQLVYLHKPSSSSLTANSRKFTATWVGPFIVHQVLDRTHYILADLEGKLLRDVFNFNRLKPAFMKATDHENITNLQKLKQVLQSKDDSKSKTANCAFDYTFIDEYDQELPSPDTSDMVFYASTAPVDLAPYKQCLKDNNNFAAPCIISEERQSRLLTALEQAPSSDSVYNIERARFNKTGDLQILLSLPLGNTQYRFWFDPQSDKNCPHIAKVVLDPETRVRCVGSPQKFVNMVYALGL